ncbi:DUF1611 domain-containing protein [Nitrosomonas sp.]|uniref:DUF1611 domain-containing protein n=1 Tax=Nitrosomonas sp. TaxID=42353 RepID=UPI001DA70D5F|nr:DUF1611 domain-containing protein [Nitrosomonas sp.]MCB1950269.1 DUF1611 domain-containing protein [Nitrosomonas sp.]MDR4514916.1 DUF1611 domain-containing protein [Nitrosomonas sp.]
MQNIKKEFYEIETGTVTETGLSGLKIVKILSSEMLQQAKIAYSCRRARLDGMLTLVAGAIAPSSGNLVLARIDELGQHKGIESREGRRHILFPGDLIIVCYGNRYAPDQFEAELPLDLSSCHLVAAGGIASKVVSKHGAIRPATKITPIGLIGDNLGNPLNIADWALKPKKRRQVLSSSSRSLKKRTPTIAVLGTSMNAGKTTSAAYLIRGLAAAGLKVGAAKITGTGSPRDINFMKDAGAELVLDFIDAGYPSTYQITNSQLESTFKLLMNHLEAAGVDIIVLEIADGIFQKETRSLCCSQTFSENIDGVIFAAGDALGAVYGSKWLCEQGLKVAGLSGLFTRSELAIREAQAGIDRPVFTLDMLSSEQIVDLIGFNRSMFENNE